MGIKLRLPNPIGVIAHPVIEDLRVEVEKPSIADSLDFSEKMKQFLRVEVAIHPDTRKPIYKQGVLQTVTIQLPVPFDSTVDQIAPHVKNVYGLDDVEFSPGIVREVLKRFLEPDLIFTEDQDVPVVDEEGIPTGQVERKPVKVNFYTHVVKKMMDAETYGRPLESPILSPATSSGA